MISVKLVLHYFAAPRFLLTSNDKISALADVSKVGLDLGRIVRDLDLEKRLSLLENQRFCDASHGILGLVSE